jgi:hypothetical protein
MLDKLQAPVFGYALNVIGLFFLASAITFKKPRRQIEELLGVERSNSLTAVREQLVSQIQTYIGFVILVIGFVLLMSDALNPQQRTPPAGGGGSLTWVIVILLASTLGTTVVLKVVQLGYVKSKFRRLLREVVRDSRFNLEKNPQLAVQIGELLNVKKEPDQSITDYIRQVRAVLRVEPNGGAGAPANVSRAR